MNLRRRLAASVAAVALLGGGVAIGGTALAQTTPPPGSGTNVSLCSNPVLNTDLAGWSALRGGTAGRQALAATGDHVVARAAYQSWNSVTNPAIYLPQLRDVTPGDTMSFAVDNRAANGGTVSARVEVEWLSGATVVSRLVGPPTPIVTSATAPARWTRVEASGVVPANATTARVINSFTAASQPVTIAATACEYRKTVVQPPTTTTTAPPPTTTVPPVTTDPTTTPPPAPADVSVTATPSAGRVDLTWTTTRTDITGWRAERDGLDTGGGGPWGIDLPATARAQDFTYLRDGTPYSFTLTPKTAGGNLPAIVVRATPGAGQPVVTSGPTPPATSTTGPPTTTVPPVSTTPGQPPPGAVTYNATSADAFVDTIGVAVHLSYLDTAYGTQNPRALLDRLGIRRIRDGAQQSSLTQYVQMHQATGRQVSIVVDSRDGDVLNALDRINAAGAGYVSQIESNNEPDCDGWQAGEVDRMKAQARAMRDRMNALPNLRDVPLATVSFCGGATSGSYLPYGDDVVSQRMNLHPYPGGFTPERQAQNEYNWSRNADPNADVTATESGYHNATSSNNGHNPISERGAGAYFPRLFLEYFRVGFKLTHTYELIDERANPGRTDPEQHFGMFRVDGTMKPAGASTAALIRTLGDAGSRPAPRPVQLATSGAQDLRVMPFLRSDGGYDVALWRTARIWDNAARTDLPDPVAQVNVQIAGAHAGSFVRIDGNENPPRTSLAAGSSFTVPVSAYPTILRLTPQGQ